MWNLQLAANWQAIKSWWYTSPTASSYNEQGQNRDESDETDGADNWFTPRNDGFPYDEVYKALNLDNQEIRVVHILPGPSESLIECTLGAHVSLSPTSSHHNLIYNAISYCAGDPNDCKPILLNGHECNCFRSLQTVMKQVRSTDQEMILWIDQICINQTNNAERESQVLLMKDIYEQAESTYVWLGEGSADSEDAFGLIKEFLHVNREPMISSIRKFDTYSTAYIQSPRKRLKLFPDDLANYLESERMWLNALESSLSPLQKHSEVAPEMFNACKWVLHSWNKSTKRKSWNAISDILQRPYWTRCWIFQEILVSSHIKVMCGRMQISWDDLVLLWHAVRFMYIYTPARHSEPQLKPWMSLNTMATLRRISGSYDLCSSLALTRDSKASDQRDKVYSLLGLLSKDVRESYGIKPNYAKSSRIVDVYLEVTVRTLIVNGSWAPLMEVTGNEISIGLPSWAPDWGGQRSHLPTAEYLMFSAGGSSFAQPSFLKGNRIMKASGFILHQIQYLGEVDMHDGHNLDKILISWMGVLKSFHGKVVPLKDFRDFFRVLRMDSEPQESLPDADCDQQTFFKSWIKLLPPGYRRGVARAGRGKRFAVLQDGNMGLVPPRARIGDVVGILEGAHTPMLFRESERVHACYNFVGECFILDFMHGEIMDQCQKGRAVATDIYVE